MAEAFSAAAMSSSMSSSMSSWPFHLGIDASVRLRKHGEDRVVVRVSGPVTVVGHIVLLGLVVSIRLVLGLPNVVQITWEGGVVSIVLHRNAEAPGRQENDPAKRDNYPRGR